MATKLREPGKMEICMVMLLFTIKLVSILKETIPVALEHKVKLGLKMVLNI